MRRTSTLHAAAAALGLLAGFAMTPAERGALEGEVTPHAVSLAWDALPAPADLPGPGMEETEEMEARVKRAEPAVRLAPVRARPPEGRRAAPAPRRERQEERRAPRPAVLRKMEMAAFQAPKRECPFAARRAAVRAAHAEAAARHAAMREAFAETHAAHAEGAVQAEMRAAYAAHTTEAAARS